MTWRNKSAPNFFNHDKKDKLAALALLSKLHGINNIKNLPRFCTGTGKSTRVAKICRTRRGLLSRGRCKSLTWEWISLALYKVLVDYFSLTSCHPHNTNFQKLLLHNVLWLGNGANLSKLWSHVIASFMTSQSVYSSKAVFPVVG